MQSSCWIPLTLIWSRCASLLIFKPLYDQILIKCYFRSQVKLHIPITQKTGLITISTMVTSNGFPLIAIMQFESKLCLCVSVVHFVPLCAVWWDHSSWFLLQPLREWVTAYLHLHPLLWVFLGYYPCCWDQPSLEYSPSKMCPWVCVRVCSLGVKVGCGQHWKKTCMHEREMLAYAIKGVGVVLTFSGGTPVFWLGTYQSQLLFP